MYIYQSRYLTRAEVWYDDEPGDLGSVDWVFYGLWNRHTRRFGLDSADLGHCMTRGG